MTEEVTSSKPPKALILAPVFYPSAGLALLLVACSILFPTASERVFQAAKNWVALDAGWFTVLAVAGFLVFVVGIAFSGFGKLKLGPDHSKPDYTYPTWFAMLFAAGMGIGLMFFGVAEPIMHYTNPPVNEGMTLDAARQAMRITFFHWGIHAWAIYAVVALSLAYFSYRHGLPLRIRSALYPLIGNRIYGPIGHTVDTFAVLGTIFGLATSLGLGVIQINSGLSYLFDIAPSVSVQVILIVIITLVATGSVVSGLDRGVRILSEINMLLAVALLAFVMIAGPTVYLLQTFVQNTGMYISSILSMTFNLYAYDPKPGWIGGWTLFYWGWWIAWSPFVGMFIARISRGRTIREFVVGVLMVPTGFTFLWMTIYGNSALHLVIAEGYTHLVDTVAADSSLALFEFLQQLPLSSITCLVATLLVVIFFVTSADSGALVIDMLSSKGEDESPVWQRVFWALLVGLLAIALLVAGGLTALQAGTIAAALPFTIVMIMMCWGLAKAMSTDLAKQTSIRYARVAPNASGDWKNRLRSLTHQPRKREVLLYLRRKADGALAQVAGELNKRGLEVQVQQGEDGRVTLQVGHGEEIDFFYAVRPQPYVPPSFMLDDPRRRRNDDDNFYRAEVFLREGGQDYDVMGWSEEDLIHDVLDQYQRHIHFLDNIR
ncbi:BCCT family transporter [Lampropedia puyangensis]|uniref:BCCT family transporter n=1 Tax=Lampropedia puyangensis TaxID=1330072 RepID=A0A4S8EXM6_9BURK|nr:choline BCCT transporter BetT [Lampropedia puyangensis]THT99288.1 BCCT family transporter [Lampropedia puyangensis]